MPPKEISHYRVVRRLGAGGMGEVFLAEDTKLDRSVALKFLPKEVAEDASRRKRFLTEAKAASALDHANVCTIYEVGETADGQPYLAMQYLEGQTLEALTRHRRLGLREIVGIGLQVADALEAARQHQVVHRDIKPGNIMVDSQGRVKVLDFGLAKRLDRPADASSLTMEGTILGTPNYLSPELALGREVDSRSDIFSLGVVLYELAAGRNPFAGGSFGETVNNILNHEPAPLRPWNPTVPAEFERIVRKCLEKDLAKRYDTPAQLRDDLANVQTHLQMPRSPHRTFLAGLAMVVALGLVGFGVAWLMRAKPKTQPTATSQQKSVAVLPFVNMSADKADEYLSDGISDDIITALSKVRGLKVPARTSCFAFKGKNEDIRRIGEQLGVRTVLEGGISRVGNKLRVNAQLINIADGFHIWSETYDRNLDDLLAIRTDVAARVAEALKGQLLGEERQQLAKRGTENAEAYRLYLHGRYLWERRTSEDVKQAIAYFNQALGKDPGYALAYSGLADSYSVLPTYTGLPRPEALPKARAAALKALELDSTLGQAHVAMAEVKAYLDRDWLGAEAEFRRAIELDPNYATAHYWFADVLNVLGRREEALVEMRLAREFDPLSRVINAMLGYQLFLTGSPDAAVEMMRKQLALDPSFIVAHHYLGWVHYHQGRLAEALGEFEIAHKLDEGGIFGLDGLGSTYARLGKTNEAQKILSQLQEHQRQGMDRRVGIARVQHALGDQESALDSLEKATTERAYGVEDVGSEPGWGDLRSRPRFQAILRKMNLVPESTASASAPEKLAPKSVAVLPFVNLSADKDDEYLSDGMTEELLNALTKVKGLRVPGRSSSFAFKGRNEEDIFRRVGEQLHVNAVLEGSVRKAGNQLRITAQLINVADGFHLWSETYDRDMTNIFAIQSDIAQQVATALKVQLGVEEARALGKEATENVEAYRLYLQGRHHWAKFSVDGWSKALDCFNQAIEKDPHYALAYAGKADAYHWLSVGLPFKEAWANGKAAALKALELDGTLAEAHSAVALSRFYNWDWSAAEKEYQQAIQLNPNLPFVRDGYANFLLTRGRFDEALREQQRAIDLDPFSNFLNVNLGWVYYESRQYNRAIEHLRKALELDPNYAESHRLLGWCLLERGQTNEALAEMRRMRSLDDTPWNGASLAYVCGVCGDTNAALQIMREWETASPPRHVLPGWRVLVYSGIGDTNNALTWLEQGFEVKDSWCPWFNVESNHKSGPLYKVRSHPRFQAVVKKVEDGGTAL